MFPSQKFESAASHQPDTSRFNGAGMFPSQKFPVDYQEGWCNGELQWGRDVSIPEMLRRSAARTRLPGFNGAGMFPSQKCPTVSQPTQNQRRFNGAGMFPSQKWHRPPVFADRMGRFNGAGMFPSQKFALRCPKCPAHVASMGPGCFHPRNGMVAGTPWQGTGLQWGRDVSIPEM